MRKEPQEELIQGHREGHSNSGLEDSQPVADLYRLQNNRVEDRDKHTNILEHIQTY